jgi:hypothetical protein
MLLPIQSDVPQPKKARGAVAAKPRKYPLPQMEIDDMFFIPNKTKNTMSTYLSVMGRHLGRKFSSRLMTMRLNGKGAWVTCEPDDPSAVTGIGVWRKE